MRRSEEPFAGVTSGDETRPTHTGTRYLVAVGCVAAGIAARFALDALLADDVPFITFFLPVVIAGWYGGVGPAVTAALLGGFAAWVLFVHPRYSFLLARPVDAFGLIVYFIVTLSIAALSGTMHAAQRRSRLAERRAVQQRELMRITLSSIGDAVITTDARGLVTFLNPVAETLCGWTAPDARGQPLQAVFRIVNEATRRPAASPVEAVLRGGHAVGLSNHTLLIGKDGAEHPIDDSAAPIRDGEGRIVGVVLVFHDVSARRAAEKELHRREQELNDFFENAAIALHWAGPDGTILRANQAELDMLGYRREEYVGRHIAEFHVDPDVIADVLARLHRGETITNREARLGCRDGSTRTVVINANVLWEDGRFVHTRCFTHDVTAQRDAEAKSRQLAAIVETSDDAIISKDLNGVVTSWNRAATRIFGYGADEMIGQSILRLIPADRVDEEPEILSRIRRGENVDHFETVRRRSDGRLIPVSLTISPIVGVGGHIVGVSKIARDITQQKQAADALREADRRKTEFLALLAHELRNPLASIHNGLHILEKSDGHTPTIVMMQRQLAQMVRLIDDLLDVSRISRGKIELRKNPVEIAAVIHDAVAAARPACDRLGHTLTVNVPPAPIVVHADAHRLIQVIGNVLDNACKFTPRCGQVSIRVERENGSVAIRVRDSGIGMIAEQIPQMFEMFMQADTSLERAQSGLGLGLALAKTLIEMHGGTIDAQSDGDGKGSEFVVRLPVSEATSAPHAAAPDTVTFSPRRILVVDDNRDSADSLTQLLQLDGHAVRAAYDGLQAVETAAEFAPDIVLLDIGLPRLNGYEVARRIRRQSGGRAPLLVALTGWGQEEDRSRSQQAGFDMHLVKPVDYALLGQILAAPL